MVQPHVRGDPPTSPWVWSATDYLGRLISVSVPFDVNTLAINGDASTHRDSACMYKKIVWDNPGDAQRAKRFTIPAGDRTIQQSVLANNGFTTYADLQAVQVTAEP